MSHRQITSDPNVVREKRYGEIELKETLEAVMEALTVIQGHGMNVGPKAEALIRKRNSIKNSIPK